MRIKKLAGVIAGCALVFTACGDDGAQPVSAPVAADEESSGEMTAEVTDEMTDESHEMSDDEATDEAMSDEATSDESGADEATADDDMSDEASSDGAATDEMSDDDAALRIVSLSPTATEMIFAIGAGEQLVAVDDFSNYPEAALDLPNELSGFEPNVEAIAGFEPDLVVIGGDFTGLTDQLAAVGIEVYDAPAAATLDDTYAQIEQLGAITGRVGDAAELVAQMQSDIDEIIASMPAVDEPLSYFHELDPTLFTTTSSTFIGQVYALLGLVNVADPAEAEAGPYPQLNAEFLVEASPDLIFLADTKCCGESAATVAERPGWSEIGAVQAGNVFEMDDDIASRWGPRVVDYLRAVADAVASLTVAA